MLLAIFILFIVAFIFCGVHLVENSPIFKNDKGKK